MGEVPIAEAKELSPPGTRIKETPYDISVSTRPKLPSQCLLRKRLIELVAWFAVICLALFLLLNLGTRGGFYFHIVTANINAFYWENVRHQGGIALRHLWPLLVGGGIFLTIGWKNNRRTWWFVATYMVAALFSGLTIGKDGSNVNYLLELNAALSLVAGTLISWARGRIPLRIAIFLILILQVNLMLLESRNGFSREVSGRIFQKGELSHLKSLIHYAKGPVLLDEPIRRIGREKSTVIATRDPRI